MKIIVIAGGIGAGKTAVTERLRTLGFNVVDADVVAHHVTEPAQPALAALCDAFGKGILRDDGSLDRVFLADIVFHDSTALRRLNSITHGYIGLEIIEELSKIEGDVAFVALPLFRPEHREALSVDRAWAVQVEPQTALHRLVEFRGFTLDDATSRLANQMSNEDRALIVDRVIWNEGSLEDLYRELDAALVADGLNHG